MAAAAPVQDLVPGQRRRRGREPLSDTDPRRTEPARDDPTELN
ncbi:hypothetical protein OG301_00935 [Streptomyces platensis]|nr:hypothetical protein OG229_37490 [Streptomyces platensis]WTI50077.1 hypothetical protein OG301_00935 [Streptomyces platensis]